MPDRLLILSDTHLGNPHCGPGSAQALRPLWNECASIVINGDTAELHHPINRARASEQLEQLKDGCQRDGVGLTLLAGNHDPYISPLRHLTLANESVLIMHGDAVHRSIAPWSARGRKMRQRFNEALQSQPSQERRTLQGMFKAVQFASHINLPPDDANAAGTKLLSMALRPMAVARLFWYWHRFPSLVARFVEQFAPAARLVITGHSHHAGIWRVRDKTIINTGCFGFPSQPRAVVVDAHRELSVFDIEKVSGEYRLAARPAAQFELHSFQRTEVTFRALDACIPEH